MPFSKVIVHNAASPIRSVSDRVLLCVAAATDAALPGLMDAPLRAALSAAFQFFRIICPYVLSPIVPAAQYGSVFTLKAFELLAVYTPLALVDIFHAAHLGFFLDRLAFGSIRFRYSWI